MMTAARDPVICEERYFTDAENREFLEIVNGIITGKCQMPDDVEVHFATHLPVPTTLIKMRIHQLCVEVLLIDFEPVCTISAPALHARVDAVWQSTSAADDFAESLAARDQSLVLAGDRSRRAELRAELEAGQATQDEHCTALLDHAEKLTNWLPIPPGVQTDIYAYTLRHEVMH
jgi:hypothetical protein